MFEQRPKALSLLESDYFTELAFEAISSPRTLSKLFNPDSVASKIDVELEEVLGGIVRCGDFLNN